MIKKIKVYECGNKCKVYNELNGIITGINIRYNNIQYEVTFINNNNTESKWYYEKEVKCNNNNKINIGFRENNNEKN